MRVPDITDNPILNTMRSWLRGEPVLAHDEILEQWGPEFLMYRIAWNRNTRPHSVRVERSYELYELRNKAIKEFGFFIPCRELLDALKQHQPIVEIGAGSGYHTALMRKHGIDVIGTDAGLGYHGFTTGRYDTVQVRLQGKTAVRRWRDRTVFCSWPTLNHTWFRQALRAMRIGQTLVTVEEDACAEADARWYREEAFKHLEDVPLPAWPHMNDRASVWIKRRHYRFPSAEKEEQDDEE